MVSGPSSPETLLASPLPCWHESLHAARTDVIVRLSARRALISTARPVPVGTLVFLELGRDAGIDGIAVANDVDTFLVEFITVDSGAAAVIGNALQQAARTSTIGTSARRTPLTFVSPVLEAEPSHHAAASLVDTPRMPTSSTAPAAVTAPLSTTRPVDAAANPPDPWTAAALRSPSSPLMNDGARGPSWVRALGADLGDEPEIPDSGHTQRWPTAHAAEHTPLRPPPAPELPWPDPDAVALHVERAVTLRPVAEVVRAPINPTNPTNPIAPEPRADPWDILPPTVSLGFDDSDVATSRWPSAHVAKVKTPPATPIPAPSWPQPAPMAAWLDVAAPAATTQPTTTAPPTTAPPTTAPPTTAPPTTTPPLTTPGAERPPADETARWPIATSTWTNDPVSPAAAAAPGVAGRTHDAGVIEVDFSEFRDVLGATTPAGADTGWIAVTPSSTHAGRPQLPSSAGAPAISAIAAPVTAPATPRSVDELWFVGVAPSEAGPLAVAPQPPAWPPPPSTAQPSTSPPSTSPPSTSPPSTSPPTAAAETVPPRSMTPPLISLREEDIVTAPGGTAQPKVSSNTDEYPFNFDEGEDVSLE
jgi:hypothetical protein